MAGKTLNKVQIIGRLGKDPELRYTTSGTAVATLSIATDEPFKAPGSNEWQSRTEWHRVVAWERTAEIAGEYLHKGSQVYIEGKLQTRLWDDKDGVKRYTTEIVARDMILLGGKGDNDSYNGGVPHPADQQGAPQAGSYPAAPATTGPPKSKVEESIAGNNPKDIPF